MSVNRWKLVSMPLVVLGIASPMLTNCSALKGVKLPGPAGDIVDAASGCDEFDSGNFAKLQIKGGAKVEGKIKGFLNASYGLKKAMLTMETDLIASCGELGKAIGMPESELKADVDGGKGAEKVCGAVAAKVESMIKANADAKLSIEVDPPQCYVPIEAMAKCLGECGSPIKGGKLEASCKGGEISGSCEAECKGSCSVEAGAACTGTCKASCSGKCDVGFKGTCGGKCDGKCDGKNSKGKCAGTCEGKCDAEAQGTCSGTCEGSCSGSCEVKAKGKCEGRCTGGCSVDVKEPTCTGTFEPPSVDPSCQLSCGAKTIADFKCDPPNVRVIAKGKVNTDLTKLVAGLQVALPKILKVQMATGAKVSGMVAGLGKAGVEIKDVALKAGGKAAVCIATGIKASAEASLSIKANVSASASIGGSVGVKGGT